MIALKRECFQPTGDAGGQFADLVLETIAEAVLVVTDDGRIAAANTRALAMFGYSDDELLGKIVEKLMPERFRARHENRRSAYVSDSQPRMMGGNLELFAQHKDGSEFPVEAGLAPMTVDGRQYVIVSIVDITARKHAEREIVRLNSELSVLLEVQSVTLENTQEALQRRTSELRHALAQLADAERRKTEEERKRLSLELHDEIGQRLTALAINLEMVRRHCNASAAAEPLQNARQIVDELVRGIREIVTQLRPPQLDDLGLVAALRWHLDRIRNSSDLKVTLQENLGRVRLAPDIEMSCFRVVQESITNVLRHAAARQIEVDIDFAADRLRLAIADDGIGFDAGAGDESIRGHFGLAGMRERVNGMRGRLAIASRPGAGCTVRAEIPLVAAEAK